MPHVATLMLSDFHYPSWQEEVAGIAILLPFGMAIGAGVWMLVRRWAGSRAARFWVAGGALTVGLIVFLLELVRLIRFYDRLSFTPPTPQVASDILARNRFVSCGRVAWRIRRCVGLLPLLRDVSVSSRASDRKEAVDMLSLRQRNPAHLLIIESLKTAPTPIRCRRASIVQRTDWRQFSPRRSSPGPPATA